MYKSHDTYPTLDTVPTIPTKNLPTAIFLISFDENT